MVDAAAAAAGGAGAGARARAMQCAAAACMALCVAALTGCGPGGAGEDLAAIPETTTVESTEVSVPPLLVEAAEGIHGFPIPATAEKVSSEEDPIGGETIRYLVDGTGVRALADWYEAHVPYGADFEDWEWCESSDDYQGEVHGDYRSWARGKYLLEVTLTTDSDWEAGIMIARKETTQGCDYLVG